MAESTLKSHLVHVMDKWSTRDRVQVVVRATQFGLVDLG